MPRIVRVGALDGNTIDVELDNGNILLLNMNLQRQNPAYAALFEGDLIIYPETDGQSVFWARGPTMDLDAIFDLLKQGGIKP